MHSAESGDSEMALTRSCFNAEVNSTSYHLIIENSLLKTHSIYAIAFDVNSAERRSSEDCTVSKLSQTP